MTTKHNFPPTSFLNTRNDLALIYNSLYDEKKQLVNKNQNTERQNEIKLYLKELLIRDKELKEINKKNFYKKREEELVQVAEDVRQHNAKKEEINTKKTEIKARILELKKELDNYAKKIGLDDLYNEYNELKKELTVPIKTSCKHRKHTQIGATVYYSGDDDGVTTYICNHCGFQFKNNSRTYFDLHYYKK
jgi:chromosome segregation ATPase